MSKKIMKRSLALGALMAFVITGNAFAAAESNYVEGEGKTLVVEIQESGKNRIVGGYASKDVSDVNKLTQNFSSDVTVKVGNWNMVMGGCYPSGLNDSTLNMNISSTKVEIYDGVSVRHLVGGTGGSDCYSITSSGSRTANLVIKGGSFGQDSDWTGNTLESLVVGGDHIKNYADAYLNNSCDVKLTSTWTKISGGTFNSLVIGGSLANQYYSNTGSKILQAYVETAKTDITGGTFYKPIIAGGVAMGANAISDVGTAILSISNATINSDVFTAGMVCYEDTSGEAEKASVKNSVVTITNTKIDGSIINTRGFARVGTNGWEFYAEDEYWLDVRNENVDKLEESVDDFGESTTTELTLTDASVNEVEITNGSVTLSATAGGQGTNITTLITGQGVTVEMVADADTTDKLKGDAEAFVNLIKIDTYQTEDEDGNKEDADKSNIKGKMNGGKVTNNIEFNLTATGEVDPESIKETVNVSNAGITDMVNLGLISWRAETNDMNKRLGELRNANGEHGVWVRMVRGEDEYGSIKNQYNQYQLGYDEKLSVDKRWTVGAALSYTDAKNTFSEGTGESTNKALSIYGSKLNDDGTFVDLIAKYARLENDFKTVGGMQDADYSTNGYSFSAEAGKRIQQGGGVWIEPQVELTYGKVANVNYVSKNGVHFAQDSIDSLIGRIGFSLGKDIKQGNVYARASYLYDFKGDTKITMTDIDNGITKDFKDDLGGGWFEVGIGTNINLSKSTYIYADVEKTFGGEVDTNWQWNLGVRYSF